MNRERLRIILVATAVSILLVLLCLLSFRAAVAQTTSARARDCCHYHDRMVLEGLGDGTHSFPTRSWTGQLRYIGHGVFDLKACADADEIWIDSFEDERLPGAEENYQWTGDKEPPTFHEIRSLAERMYHEQGNVNTQDLLGHENPETTRLYHDARGAEWTRVKVGIK